jgi:hypothetical protein
MEGYAGPVKIAYLSADFRLRQKSVIKKDDLIIPPSWGALTQVGKSTPGASKHLTRQVFSEAAAAEPGTLAVNSHHSDVILIVVILTLLTS